MKDLDKRDEFDDQWKNAFEDAEWQPRENVWLNINSSLVEKENNIFRRKALFFKWVAAASLFLALSVGLISNLDWFAQDSITDRQNNSLENDEGESSSFSKNNNEPVNAANGKIQQDESVVAQNETEGSEIASGDNFTNDQNSSSLVSKGESQPSSAVAVNKTGDGSNDNVSTGLPLQNEPYDKNEVLALEKREDETILKDQMEGLGDQSGLYLASTIEPMQLNDLSEIEQPSKTTLYRVPEEWRMKEQKKKNDFGQDLLWAGVNFSSGLFDPNFQNSNTMQESNFLPSSMKTNTLDAATFLENSVPDNTIEEESQPGISYAAGVNFGMNLSKRILLESGVYYAVNNSNSTTNLVVQDYATAETIPVHVSNYSMQAMRIASRQEQAPVDIQNRFEFVSVPLKAGYIVAGNRLQLVLSGGFSADFFQKNTLSGESAGYQSIDIFSGNESPYRNVFFNGLLGTEITYRLMDQYMLMLAPSYRFSLTNFAKDNYFYNSFPQSFNIGVGFKYILR